MTFFPEGSPAKFFLKWFKEQEKKEFSIHDVIELDIEISDRTQVIWQLIDNNDLELVNGLIIRVKGEVNRCE